MTENKKYIVTQVCVDSETLIGNNNRINLSDIIRVVYAESEAEAIGKFILTITDVNVKQRLNPKCYLIDDILTIK